MNLYQCFNKMYCGLAFSLKFGNIFFIMDLKFHGFPSFVLACKFNALKMGLKKWIEEIFSNAGKWEKDFVDGIRKLEIIAEGRPFIADERLRKESNRQHKLQITS
jgi:hypothetical protein